MSELSLVHYGIKGQKWGQQNGPPYPLSRSDMSSAERKADTGEIDRSYKKTSSYKSRGYKGNTELADYRNMDKNDLKEMVERMELENRYLRAVDARRGKSFLEKTASTMNSVGQILDSTNKMAQFVTGKTFVQNLTAIADKVKAKNASGDDDITSIWDSVSSEVKIGKKRKISDDVVDAWKSFGIDVGDATSKAKSKVKG